MVGTKKARQIWLVALVMTTTALVLISAGSAQAAWSGKNGKIGFESDEDGDYDIFSQKVDGSGRVNLSNLGGNSSETMHWSPNGKRYCFDYNNDIWVGRPGDPPSNITDDVELDSTCAWSKNGERVLFSSNRDGDRDIWSLTAQGTDLLQVSNLAGEDYDPAVSPRGHRIAFTSDADGDFDIYTMNANGLDVEQLTKHPGDDYAADYRPDGKRMTYTSQADGNYDIWTMSATGGKKFNVTDDNVDQFGSAYSPDGRQIAFSKVNGLSDIFRMRENGTRQRNITKTPGFYEWYPDWQPV